MSKIICKCGNILPDITDSLSYKGHDCNPAVFLHAVYCNTDGLLDCQPHRWKNFMMNALNNQKG